MLPGTSRIDTPLLFTTRIVRLFCYGFLSVVLSLFLAATGMTERTIGLLFTLTLAGDAGITLWLTTSADRIYGSSTFAPSRSTTPATSPARCSWRTTVCAA